MKTYIHPFESKAFLLIAWLLLLCSSCKKFVQIPPPKDELVTSTVFGDSASATAAVLGIYINMISNGGIMDGSLSIYTGLSSDELIAPGAGAFNPDYLQFYENALTSSNGTNESSIWGITYRQMYAVNACIEGLSTSNRLGASVKNELLGEAKFVRAFMYFNLVNLFGAVPLELSTDYQVNARFARVSVDSVYIQIVKDLTDAESLLNPNSNQLGDTRPDLYADLALLSRVYLYEQNWNMADSISNIVIQSGQYQLVSGLDSVFLPGSTEAIWQLIPVLTNQETPEGVDYIPFSSYRAPQYAINSFLLNAFENGDNRRVNWLDSISINGQVYYYPYKYKLGVDFNTTPLEHTTVLRLAEQYLIRAEAEANGAGGGVNTALADLNVIRTRAGLANYAGATDQGSILTAIYHERQVELCIEWGHRWFDLKRTGLLNTVMGADGDCTAKGGTWSPNAALYPIPLSQFVLNPSLIQNPGY